MFRRFMSRFARASEGAVAILFAACMTFVILTCGLAFDYAVALRERQSLQHALDAGLLAAATRPAGSTETVQQIVQKYIDASYSSKFGTRNFNLTVTDDGTSRLDGVVTMDVPTRFMQIVGIDQVPVELGASIMYGLQDVEIALVMDNTGSMAGSRLDALRASAKDLLDVVYAKSDADRHVKVALVPFSRYVNVGVDKRNASWIDVPLDSSESREWCRNEYPNATRSNCRMVTGTCSNDGTTSSCQSEQCDTSWGDPVWTCSTYNDVQVWRGCVGSRPHPLNTKDESYGTRVPGLMNRWCSAPITPLTNDRSLLRNRIDAMAASDDTFIPAGLMWGWAALSPDGPFTEAQPYRTTGGTRIHKVLVLMTDGQNTVSPDYPDHYGSDVTLANTLTAELCANVKAAGLQVITVAYEVTDPTIRSILQACATSGSDYYNATSASELNAAFNAIGMGLTAMRIAR